MAAPFRYLLRVRYPECDAQGIVFNARYGDWTDIATTELVRAIDPDALATLDYRLRQQTTEWLAPARFDDIVAAAPAVARVGTTSFAVATTFTRWPGGDVLARVDTTYVLVDTKTGRPVPVSGPLRARLLEGAPGRVTDHAGVGGGRVTHVVRAADRVAMPWKNGGGVTHEVVRVGEGAAGFAARVSMAEVATDGPFSAFPGVDRVILLLDGAGFVLRRGDGLEVRVDRPHVPFAFLGEDAWHCRLVDGPVLDLNVMTDRATRRAAVRVVGPGRVEATWVVALEAGRVGDEEVVRGDLVALDGPVVATGVVVAIDVVGVGEASDGGERAGAASATAG